MMVVRFLLESDVVMGSGTGALRRASCSSSLGNHTAEGLPGDLLRGRTTADAGVEGVDRIELVRGQREAEDIEVLRDPRGSDGLRDDLASLLEVPAQHHLGRRSAVRGGDLADGRVL